MRYLLGLYETLKDEDGGAVADYIPELSKANPKDFGLAIATVDGTVYAVGESEKPFTIQSISKAFVYGHALAEYGRDYVLTKVGVEPSGDAFNAIVFDEVSNRPFNPMVNSGAIATAALVRGTSVENRITAVRDLFARFAGRDLSIDDAVFRSERQTGHRNRAIAWMMLNAEMIEGSPDEVLDIYFAQCSIEVTCRDLAMMAATLANGGLQPMTRLQVLPVAAVRDVISVISSCGMYNYAGEWSFEIGLPAKSGVAGGIMAVVPGQLGIAVYSPPLDRLGNSVRGIAASKAISRDFGLHVFSNQPNAGTVIRRETSGDVARSKRLRSVEERRILDGSGRRVRVIELQGALYFSAAERLIHRIEEIGDEADWVICDFRHVHNSDQAAAELLIRAYEAANGPKTLAANLPRRGCLTKLAEKLGEKGDRLFADTDTALQWCEDQLIGRESTGLGTRFALAELAIFAGLAREEIKLIEGVVSALVFKPGDVIIREGDAARLFFVIARGTVGVYLRAQSSLDVGRGKRIATFGPGLSFGEMALFDGGRRSADIVAEEHVDCYGIGVEDIQAIGKEHPNVLLTVLSNVNKEMAERLRRANDEIRALEL